jgi:hypothetical protein
MPWIIVSHLSLVATPNWCGKKCVAKVLGIKGINCNL